MMDQKPLTAKEFLSQTYLIDLRINTKIEQISQLHDLATKANSTLSDTPNSGTRNCQRMEDTIIKIIDLEHEITSDIDELVDLKKAVIGLIKAVTKSEYQTILEQRYLCFYQWDVIADNMGYSSRYLHKLHQEALQHCDELLKEDTKVH